MNGQEMLDALMQMSQADRLKPLMAMPPTDCPATGTAIPITKLIVDFNGTPTIFTGKNP